MSVVACRIYDDRIEIGSDSITMKGYTQEKAKNKYLKLAEVNNMIIGGVGLCEESAMLFMFCGSRKPKDASEDSLLEFMCEFAEWKKKRIDNYELKNEYLFVIDKKVFLVEHFFVKEIVQYEAIGAGMDYALSALYLGHGVEKAVEVACELSVFCEKPIKIFKVDK